MLCASVVSLLEHGEPVERIQMKAATGSSRAPLRAAAGLIDLPVPPLSLRTTENAYRLGEVVQIALNDGARVRGALLAFRADQGRLLVRLDSDARIEAREIYL